MNCQNRIKANLLLKLPLLLLAIVSYTSAFSQSDIVSGEIMDMDSGEYIPYVHISIAGTSFGNISNSEGRFEILIPEKHRNGTITFSCIGYETLGIPIDSLVTSYNRIYLKPATFTLNELVITNLSPREIIKKCIDKIPDNYIQYPVSIAGYYLSATKEEGQFRRCLEAGVDIYNKNFFRYKEVHLLDSTVNENAFDYRTFKIEEPSSVHGSLSFDHVLHGKGFLNPRNLDSWNFEVKGAFEGDNILIIEARYIAYENKIDHQAEIFIDRNNFAILKIAYDYKWNSKKLIASHDDSLATAYHQWSGVFHYTRQLDRYFLKSFNYNVTQGVYDKFTTELIAVQEIRNELIVN